MIPSSHERSQRRGYLPHRSLHLLRARLPSQLRPQLPHQHTPLRIVCLEGVIEGVDLEVQIMEQRRDGGYRRIGGLGGDEVKLCSAGKTSVGGQRAS
ncbi:unnamed protein product [Linum trigynum]|uniref:Uncharacterized protein n=1 Tax=Linum trigynum TaxID=586398 RepID=A0AAV2EUC8_9ROSI